MTSASARQRRIGDLPRRLVMGVLLAGVGLGSVVDSRLFTLLILVIALASLWELDRLSALKGQELVFPVAAGAVATYLLFAEFGLLRRFEPALVAATIVGALAVALFGSRSGYFARSAFTLLGVLYIGKLLSYFITLRNVPRVGAEYTVGVILLIATTDICAMLVGSAFGRTPLTPISPRKTWEGALGGFAAATILGALLALSPGVHIAWWHGAIVGAVTSLAAQAGDLVESAMKRDAHVKDAGTGLGSHGGWLDRFDSYLFGGVAFYGAMWVTGHLPGGPQW